MNYFEARKLRYIRNQEEIIHLIEEVQKLDESVEAYVHHDNRYIDNVVFFKGEEINSVSFQEVPYHWSGCGCKSHTGLGDSQQLPFTAEDVLGTFNPVTGLLFRQPNEKFRSKEHYLKWYGFLINYKDRKI